MRHHNCIRIPSTVGGQIWQQRQQSSVEFPYFLNIYQVFSLLQVSACKSRSTKYHIFTLLSYLVVSFYIAGQLLCLCLSLIGATTLSPLHLCDVYSDDNVQQRPSRPTLNGLCHRGQFYFWIDFFGKIYIFLSFLWKTYCISGILWRLVFMTGWQLWWTDEVRLLGTNRLWKPTECTTTLDKSVLHKIDLMFVYMTGFLSYEPVLCEILVWVIMLQF